jgi:hypothetical protein
MAAKLKIEKRGDEILIVHCCFSISQNELMVGGSLRELRLPPPLKLVTMI